ncbi:MAG: hypothetical protein ACREPR_07205 [Brasilonema sp.]
METNIETIAQPRILWLQVCSLAGVQGAITQGKRTLKWRATRF